MMKLMYFCKTCGRRQGKNFMVPLPSGSPSFLCLFCQAKELPHDEPTRPTIETGEQFNAGLHQPGTEDARNRRTDRAQGGAPRQANIPVGTTWGVSGRHSDESIREGLCSV